MSYGSEHHLVLTSTLPGGKIMPELFEAIERNEATRGERTLIVDMVLAENFNYDTPSSFDTGIIIGSGSRGFLPVMSKKYLSPSEFELLSRLPSDRRDHAHGGRLCVHHDLVLHDEGDAGDKRPASPGGAPKGERRTAAAGRRPATAPALRRVGHGKGCNG